MNNDVIFKSFYKSFEPSIKVLYNLLIINELAELPFEGRQLRGRLKAGRVIDWSERIRFI